jgi:rubrerythrin
MAMNILDFALTMEKDGEEFYRKLGKESQDAGLKAIFTFLADAEARHYDIVQMKEDQAPEGIDAPVLDEAENVFANMAPASVADLADPQSTDRCVALYRQAQEVEKKSMEFYAEKAAELEDGPQKAMLLKLSEEEKRHFWIMYNLVDHVGRTDHGWIEFAEWNHMEQY